MASLSGIGYVKFKLHFSQCTISNKSPVKEKSVTDINIVALLASQTGQIIFCWFANAINYCLNKIASIAITAKAIAQIAHLSFFCAVNSVSNISELGKFPTSISL